MVTNLIRVMLADDTLIAIEGWKAILSTSKDIAIVGEAQTIQETKQKVRQLLPDVLLMDLKWQGDKTAGWITIGEIKATHPKIKVIAITAYEDLILDARRAGADAALTKTFTRDELIGLIKELADQQIDPPQTRLMETYTETLTGREIDVVKLMETGCTDREIAENLGIAVSTAKNHVKNIISKLNAKNRTHAVNLAREKGFI